MELCKFVKGILPVFMMLILFLACKKQQTTLSQVTKQTNNTPKIELNQCDSAVVFDVEQSDNIPSVCYMYPDLHFCMNEDTILAYSDSMEISQYITLDEDLQKKQNGLFDMLRKGIKREKLKKFREPLLGQYGEDYEIKLYKNSVLILDTMVFYGPDYQYLSDDMLSFVEDLNSLFYYYNNNIFFDREWKTKIVNHETLTPNPLR